MVLSPLSHQPVTGQGTVTRGRWQLTSRSDEPSALFLSQTRQAPSCHIITLASRQPWWWAAT